MAIVLKRKKRDIHGRVGYIGSRGWDVLGTCEGGHEGRRGGTIREPRVAVQLRRDICFIKSVSLLRLR
jgi:hypothetical protein